jgi:uncharacterized membrane protein YbhN (UPF0104 family)
MVDILQSTALNATLLMGSGDLYKVRRVRTSVPSLMEWASYVLLDRMLGLLTLACLGVASFLAFAPDATSSDSQSDEVILFAGVALLGLLALVLLGRTKVHGVLGRLWAPWQALQGSPRAVARVLAGYAAWLASVHMLARSLGIDAPVYAFAYAAPLVAMASLLPISIGGLGVRELSYALLLSSWGVPSAAAVSPGLAQYALFIAMAAAGLLCFVGERRFGRWEIQTAPPRTASDGDAG